MDSSLALTRQIPQHDAIVKRGEWHRGVGRELAGKILGLLGLGRIGREVAQRAVAFDMRVSAYDVTWDEAFARQWGIIRHPTAEEVLRHADVVSLHMHLSDANRAYINAARLALMKPGAYLVNCARGGLINEGDVAAALQCGQLVGYGADVVEQEPVVPTNPLLTAPNVVLTPHVGSRTYESVECQAIMAVENMLRVLHGQPPHARANTL